MTTIDKSFTDVGAGNALLVRAGELFTYSVSGTFDATVVLEVSKTAGQTWESLVSATAAASGTIQNSGPEHYLYRFRCTVFDSGTVVTSLVESAQVLNVLSDKNGVEIFKVDTSGVSVLKRASQKKITPAAVGKVGATAGFVVAAANNLSLVTCPAAQTASTLVIPVTGLKVGDTITGFYVDGQIESAGNTVTLDANLRKLTAAAADVTDASVGSITQVSVIADTIVDSALTEVSGLSEVVGSRESFYILLTATTGASTDIALQSVTVIVTEA